MDKSNLTTATKRKGLHGYSAFVLTESSRQKLAVVFPPKYPEWIGHHITKQYGVAKDPNQEYGGFKHVTVVGYADAGDGIEAFVVNVDGTIKRPDSLTYHITWSLDRSQGKKPVDSNKLINEHGFVAIDPILIDVRYEHIQG